MTEKEEDEIIKEWEKYLEEYKKTKQIQKQQRNTNKNEVIK